MTLQELKAKLNALDENVKVYHYYADPRTACPYVVWFEQPSEDMNADNIHGEFAYDVTITYYTKSEFDPYVRKLRQLLNEEGNPWSYNNIEFLSDENVISHEFNAVCMEGE